MLFHHVFTDIMGLAWSKFYMKKTFSRGGGAGQVPSLKKSSSSPIMYISNTGYCEDTKLYGMVFALIKLIVVEILR